MPQAVGVDCERTEVDGVPVFWAEAPGELRAALVFRVGFTDEAPVQRGITHLVEHLALSTIDDGVHHAWNGFVDPVRTVFHAAGRPDEIVAFLAQVCRALGALPLERLATEKQILRAESAGHSAGVVGDLLHTRYGMQGPGLSVLREFALEAASAEEVAGWAGACFGRANAGLWLSGEPPADLRLPLGDGPRLARPELPPTLVTEPTYFPGPPDGAALGVVNDGSPAAQVAMGVLEQRLTNRLRRVEGTSYSIGWGSGQIAADAVHMALGVDAAQGKAPAAWWGLREEAERLAADGPSDQEVADVVARTIRQIEVPDAALGYLDRCVMRELTGPEHRTRSAAVADLQAVSAAEVGEAFAASLSEVVYKVPVDAGRPEGLAAVPESSATTVDGQRFAAVSSTTKPAPSLTVGPGGVTAATGERVATVATDDCVAVLRWADGSRAALGRDGFSVHIDPTAWRDGAGAVARFDATFAAVPAVTVGRRRRAPTPQPFVAVRVPAPAAVVGLMGLLVTLVVVAPVAPWAALGLLAVAFAGFVGLGRLARSPRDAGVQVYDDCQSVDWSAFPTDLPASQVYVRCGFLLGWFVSRGLVNEWFVATSGDDLEEFRAGAITAPQLYERWDGVLASDMLSAEGAAFARWYVREPERQGGLQPFDRDYTILTKGLPNAYAVADTAENFATFCARADASLARWRRWRWLYDIRSVDLVPGAKVSRRS